jgi:hypothetical protein
VGTIGFLGPLLLLGRSSVVVREGACVRIVEG